MGFEGQSTGRLVSRHGSQGLSGEDNLAAEVSEGVQVRIETLAKVRLAKEGCGQMEGRGVEGRFGVIKGDLRRRISLASVRANTDC